MNLIAPPPKPGQIVRVRQRQYLVEETIPPPEPGDATLVRLSCVDDDAQGQSLAVLWESEVDPKILTAESWERIANRGFDSPRLFAAYLHTLRWNCVTATDPRLFQSPFRAGIRIDAYQLEPLRKALLLPRVNLFIADDVGLGKTIEAGLISQELLLRKKVKEIVIACPPSMLFQWREEMEARFGLAFQILDRDYVARVRQERGYGVNSWATHTRFLVSHRLLVDESYAAPLRDWLGDFRSGSLLVLDEAHHAAPSSGARYAIDSKMTRAVRDLAHRFEHRLFLSATPHNGHSNSFSALLEILDPQRFCRGVPVQGKLRDEVLVRRLKDDIRAIAGGFPKRSVKQIDIENLPADAPELRLSNLLNRYRELREKRLETATKREQAAAGLLVSGLQQRLLSSIEGFARTLRVHRRTVEKHWEEFLAGEGCEPQRPGTLSLLGEGVGNDDEWATVSEDELRAEEEAQLEAASAATVGPLGAETARSLFAQEQRLLDEMTEIAEATRALPDARVRHLIRWIEEHMCLGLPPVEERAPRKRPVAWNETRVIIFTEYDDTKRYLREQLSAAIANTDRADDRIAVFHGPTPLEEREEIKRAFNTDPAKHPVRILIATDAAREGLNLQSHCWNLFHFDVPWNPSRLEQRNGRIDRKLQPRPEVLCHYFVYQQRPEDRVLRVLVQKTDTIKRELGSLAQVVEGRLAETLRMGIRHADVARLAEEIRNADLEEDRKRWVAEELEEARERQEALRAQIERLRDRLANSKKWIGLEENRFRSALSSSLELMGADPLRPLGVPIEEDHAPGRFAFPALDRRQGADPTWADTMDTLRAPRRREQKPWEWRKSSPVRPVVFEDPGTMDDEVVHLHLEHRVVRRLLGRFTAQGFIHHDLSRACLTHTGDAIARVILLGRLALYGPGGTRLHEEIVPVTARWTDPADRAPGLAPYGRQAEARTLDLLEEALLRSSSQVISDTVIGRLRTAALRDVVELLPYLQERGENVATDARQKLEARGGQEARAMASIIESQKKRVSETAHKYQDVQQTLGFDPDERRQVEANRRHWQRRLADLDRELATEPDRIRENYVVKAERMEPIGLAYLWPVTG